VFENKWLLNGTGGYDYRFRPNPKEAPARATRSPPKVLQRAHYLVAKNAERERIKQHSYFSLSARQVHRTVIAAEPSSKFNIAM